MSNDDSKLSALQILSECFKYQSKGSRLEDYQVKLVLGAMDEHAQTETIMLTEENRMLKRSIESWKKEEEINNEAFRDYKKRIEQLEAEKQTDAMEWISVDERLPDEEGFYLVLIDVNGFIEKVQFQKLPNQFWWERYGEIKAVTHWMPLPKAPNQQFKTK